MKKILVVTIVGIALLAMMIPAMAGTSATQSVTYQVSAINEITVSGNPGALIVSSATAGSNPNNATDNTTSYAVTTNGTAKKITIALNSNMPDNVILQANLTAPTGGTSAGALTLTNVAQDAVTGITTIAEGNKTIDYTLSAALAAGTVASASKTVTLTLADGS